MSSASVLPRVRFVAAALAAALLAVLALQVVGLRQASNARAATAGIVQITMTVKGHKQGFFKGDNPASKAGANTIVVVAYQYSVISPRDPQSGLPTGQRQHHPVVITHELGASSPQFFTAVVTNETLDSVVISFSKTQTNGRETVFYVVTLTDATISELHQYSSGSTVLEDISFTFRKIEQLDKLAGTQGSDDWAARV
ncbi:MAG TPA: type VI secretion system tube protein TssD [Candidatus Dormibacteraeota bacterium]|nr:type VI secretion system tube protein TssD [Candidatus Dormibacteraeota bacterium]